MAKKKKNKKSKVQSMGWGEAFRSNKPDKGTDVKKKGYKALKKVKHVNRSLDKEERRDVRKEANRVPKVPEKIMKIRAKCNHAGPTMTVEEFKSLPNPHITPLLDLFEEVFSDSDIAICEDCKEALLNSSAISMDNLKVAAATMIGTIGYITSHIKMSKKEIKEHAEMKETLFEMLCTLQDELDEAQKKDAEYEAYRRARRNELDREEEENHDSVVKLGGKSANTTFARAPRDDDDED